MTDISEQNIKSFGSTEGVLAYDTVYLRESEKHVIETYMPRGSKILDVGCGTGRTTKFIAEHGAEVVAIDPAEPLIARAKERYPALTFDVQNVLRLPYKDESFDTVFFSFNGIDNLYPGVERKAALAEMKRVLKKNGYLIYASHNGLAFPRTPRGLMIVLKNLFRLRVGPHWRKENHGFGELFQYYNNIWNESRMIRAEGLHLIEIVGNKKRQSKTMLAVTERFPIYVTRKNA